MITGEDLAKHREGEMKRIAQMGKYERTVSLALATYTPPPKVVTARHPRIRKGGLPPFK